MPCRLLFLFLLLAGTHGSVAGNEFWHLVNTLGRWQGIGSSDGYHSNRTRPGHPHLHLRQLHAFGYGNPYRSYPVRPMDRLQQPAGYAGAVEYVGPTLAAPLNPRSDEQDEPAEERSPRNDREETDQIRSPSDRTTSASLSQTYFPPAAPPITTLRPPVRHAPLQVRPVTVPAGVAQSGRPLPSSWY